MHSYRINQTYTAPNDDKTFSDFTADPHHRLNLNIITTAKLGQKLFSWTAQDAAWSAPSVLTPWELGNRRQRCVRIAVCARIGPQTARRPGYARPNLEATQTQTRSPSRQPVSQSVAARSTDVIQRRRSQRSAKHIDEFPRRTIQRAVQKHPPRR